LAEAFVAGRQHDGSLVEGETERWQPLLVNDTYVVLNREVTDARSAPTASTTTTTDLLRSGESDPDRRPLIRRIRTSSSIREVLCHAL